MSPAQIEINPNLLNLLALLSGTGTTTGTPTTPTQPSAQLQEFLAAIPFANDGDVITADHHNTLRAALGRIAASLDETQFAKVQTLSFTPVLLPVLDQPSWRVTLGKALGPEEGSDAVGWMLLDLPDGTNIDSFRVRGRTSSKPSFWTAEIRRHLRGGDVVLVVQSRQQ